MYVCSDIKSKDDFLNPCRPCELLPRNVRGTFTLLEGLLTCAVSRLNSRDSLREWAANTHPQNTFNMDSLKSGHQKESHKGTMHEKATFQSTELTAISDSMQQSTIMDDYTPCKHESNTEPILIDVEKQV
jgi:hypothetical protein